MFEIAVNPEAAYMALGLEPGATIKQIKEAAKTKAKASPGLVGKALAESLQAWCIMFAQHADSKKPAGEKTNRATKADNAKRPQILARFKELEDAKTDQETIIRTVRTEFNLTYPNVYYYWGRVYKKK